MTPDAHSRVQTIGADAGDTVYAAKTVKQLKAVIQYLLFLQIIALLNGLFEAINALRNVGGLYVATLAVPRTISQLMILIAFVVFLLWLYRISYNTHHFATNPPSTQPGWAIGLFFVPVIMLFRPFQVVRDLWVINVGGSGNIVLVWWIAWIGSALLYEFGAAWIGEGQRVLGTWLTISAFLIDLLSSVSLLYIVRHMTYGNERLMESL